MPSQPIVRSRLVIEMQNKTSVDCLNAAMRNFKSAYTVSDAPEDIIMLLHDVQEAKEKT